MSEKKVLMKAVVMAGGKGTRLRPLTFSISKPLLPVREKPILQRIIEQLRDSGITDLVLATVYHSELVRAFCGRTGDRWASVFLLPAAEPEPWRWGDWCKFAVEIGVEACEKRWHNEDQRD